jgi:hypothetical protein
VCSMMCAVCYTRCYKVDLLVLSISFVKRGMCAMLYTVLCVCCLHVLTLIYLSYFLLLLPLTCTDTDIPLLLPPPFPSRYSDENVSPRTVPNDCVRAMVKTAKEQELITLYFQGITKHALYSLHMYTRVHLKVYIYTRVLMCIHIYIYKTGYIYMYMYTRVHLVLYTPLCMYIHHHVYTEHAFNHPIYTL